MLVRGSTKPLILMELLMTFEVSPYGVQSGKLDLNVDQVCDGAAMLGMH